MKEKLIPVKTPVFAMILLAMALLMPATGNCFTAMAQVDKTRITLEDRVSLQIVVEGGQAVVDLSPIQDFKVVRSGTSTSHSYINGKSQHQVIYNYQLVPIKTGVLKIPPLRVSQEKETLATKEVQILVSRTPVSANQPRQVFVEAHVGASDLVTGQQTVYTIKLYTTVRFARASLKTPDLDAFAAQELEQRKNYTQTVNGIPYQVTEIFYILQAQKPGSFEIEPAVIMADVIQPRSGSNSFDSFFNDSFFSAARTRSIQVSSNTIPLQVRPLPAYTGDQPFSGLVGQFTLAAAIDKPTLAAGESVTLSLTLQGKGNIMDAGPLPLNLDPGRVKVYEDTPTEEIAATETGFSGKKIFKSALVPLAAGTLIVPSFSLIYFDVATGEYKTVKTREIVLDVMGKSPAGAADPTPGNGQGGNSEPGGSNLPDSAGQKQEVVMVNKDILDIKESVSILSSSQQLAFPLFLLLVFAPGFIYGGFAVMLRFRTREKSNETLMTQRARQALKTAQKLAASDQPFLNHVQTGLVAAVLAKGNKQGESLTCGEARQILMQTGTKAGVIDEVVTLLEKLDATRFGGEIQDNSNKKVFLERVSQIVKLLSITLFCLGLFFYTPVPVYADPAAGTSNALHPPGQSELSDLTGPFMNGIKQYKAGEFKDAAASFETIAASGVINPDLFYNIGNAYLKAHDLGNAILWYERAKCLAPEDPDLLFNLAHANTLVKDKIDSPVTLTDILFFWQGLVPLQWLQAGAIVISWLFFLWAGIQRFRQKSIFTGMGWGLISLLLVLCLASGMEEYRGRAGNRAVIVQETAAVRSGTLETSTKLFELHAGTRVQVKARKNGYLKIRLAKGRMGWVKPGAAKEI
jgi:hypothetical protein